MFSCCKKIPGDPIGIFFACLNTDCWIKRTASCKIRIGKGVFMNKIIGIGILVGFLFAFGGLSFADDIHEFAN